jgi:hypothetical protein
VWTGHGRDENTYFTVEKPIDPGIRWGINLKMKI